MEAADIVLVAVVGTLTAEVAAVGVLDNIAAEHSRSGHQQDYIAKIAAVGCPDDLSSLQKVSSRAAFEMSFANHNLYITGADDAKVELFDMQGRPVFKALGVKGSISLQGVANGLYVVRVTAHSNSLMKRIVVR